MHACRNSLNSKQTTDCSTAKRTIQAYGLDKLRGADTPSGCPSLSGNALSVPGEPPENNHSLYDTYYHHKPEMTESLCVSHSIMPAPWLSETAPVSYWWHDHMRYQRVVSMCKAMTPYMDSYECFHCSNSLVHHTHTGSKQNCA